MTPSIIQYFFCKTYLSVSMKIVVLWRETYVQYTVKKTPNKHKFRHEIRQCNLVLFGGERFFFLNHGMCSIAVVIFSGRKMPYVDG